MESDSNSQLTQNQDTSNSPASQQASSELPRPDPSSLASTASDPTDSHTTGSHTTDSHTTDRHTTDRHTTDRHTTDSHTTDSYPDALTPTEVISRLQRLYGPVELGEPLDPLSELVLTILSQNTSDANSSSAFAALRKRFGDWDRVRRARVKTIVNTIRSGGLAEQKAPRIKNILQQIYLSRGTLSLDHLDQMTDTQAVEYLTSFDGVGPKTAACVLMFASRRPVLPVDTHVHRLAMRLTLIPQKTTADQAHQLLQSQLANEQVIDFHVQSIRHGRQLCKARRPLCHQCVLQDRCQAAPEYLEHGVTKAARAARVRELLAQLEESGLFAPQQSRTHTMPGR